MTGILHETPQERRHTDSGPVNSMRNFLGLKEGQMYSRMILIIRAGISIGD